MAWAKNGSTDLSSAGDNITLSNLTASKTNMFLCHGYASGSNPVMAIQYNSDTGSNYARRGSTNGSADGTATSGTYAHLSGGGLDTGAGFVVGYILNVSSEEKLSINFFTNGATVGAATVPDRGEYTGKWANTSDSITTINITNANTGDFGTNSNLLVLGSDLTPASAKTIETGSIYIDTDINARWWYDGTNWNMQPTFDNLFSTDNMTHNTSQTAIESGYFRVNHRVGSGADDHAYWDLGTTLSDNWVMRCKFSCTAKSSSTSNPNTAGLFSLSATNDNDFSVNGLGFKVSIGGGGNYDNLFFAGGTSNQSGGEGYNFSGISDFDNINNAGTTKYVEIIKNGTSITMNVYDDEYVTLYDTFTTTHTGTMTGLRYFTYKNRDDIAGSHTETIHIDDLRIYDGVTSVQQ